MMTPQLLSRVRQSLIKHAGWEKKPYVDSVGKIIIGCAYNLSERGIGEEWINEQFVSDVAYFYSNLCAFPWFHFLNDDRQVVLVDMAFMGWKKFIGLEKMIAALEKKDYVSAAEEMLKGEWAKECKGRPAELAEGMRTGVYHV